MRNKMCRKRHASTHVEEEEAAAHNANSVEGGEEKSGPPSVPGLSAGAENGSTAAPP